MDFPWQTIQHVMEVCNPDGSPCLSQHSSRASLSEITITGSHDDPGLMVLSLVKIFDDRDRLYADDEFQVRG